MKSDHTFGLLAVIVVKYVLILNLCYGHILPLTELIRVDKQNIISLNHEPKNMKMRK